MASVLTAVGSQLQNHPKHLAIKRLQHLALLTLFPRAGTLLRRRDGRRGQVDVGGFSSHVACDGQTGDCNTLGRCVNRGRRWRWRWRWLTEDESGDLPALLGGHVLHRVQRRQALLVNHVHVDTWWTTGETLARGRVFARKQEVTAGAEGGADLRREASAPRPSSRRERPRGGHCLSPSEQGGEQQDVRDTHS